MIETTNLKLQKAELNESYNLSQHNDNLDKIDNIIESGSNENGSYEKYSNGILKCYLYLERTDIAIDKAYGPLFQNTILWTYPIPFATLPAVIPGSFRWGSGVSWGAIGGIELSSATLVGIDISNRASGPMVQITAMAVGRWK